MDYPDYPCTTTVQLLGHACLRIASPEYTLITDPWLIGDTHAGGWYPTKEPPDNYVDILNNADSIFISHTHGDHLHRETLKKIKSSIRIVIPPFTALKTILENWGFDNVKVLNFKEVYVIGDSTFTLFPSGDDREDSGFYFRWRDFSLLSSVDSNNLNFGVLPNATVYASSYAGGASSYPLLFDTITEEDKKKIIENNLVELMKSNKKTRENCQAKYYMPYAGFTELSDTVLDYVVANDSQWEVRDYTDPNYTLLDTDMYSNFVFNKEGKLLEENTIERRRVIHHMYPTIKNLDLPEPSAIITKYFTESKFNENIVLFLTLTNQKFDPIDNEKYIIYFNRKKPKVEKINYDWSQENKRLFVDDRKLLHLKIPIRVCCYWLYNYMPLEDIAIGYQCKEDRIPNEHFDKAFWTYFSNEYVSGINHIKPRIK